MRFTIVGAGALGTIIGAHLIAAGHPVVMVARGARAATLRRDGLRVRGLADLSLRCETSEHPQALGPTDVLLLATKTHQLAAAIEGVRHLECAAVLSVANGVLKNEQLALAFGAGRVLGCMADTSGELRPDGVVEFTRNVGMRIGAYRAPDETPAGEVAAAIDGAGVVTRAVEDIATVEWSKLVAWVAMFALSVTARRPSGQYLREPALARLAVALIKEAGAIAAHAGVALTDDAPMPVVSIIEAPVEEGAEKVIAVGRTYAENAPTHRMSGLQDLEAGRRLEVHETLGHLVRRAREAGLAVPALACIYELVSGIDALQA